MGIEQQFAPSPQHGAAWRTILERVDPGLVITQEDVDKARQKIRAIQEWARTLPLPLRIAYLWASARVEDAVRERFKLHENARRVLAAYDEIPKPPES